MRLINPLELFAFLRHRPEDSPEDIRVFEGNRFLYASFQGGREQIIHASALTRSRLIEFWTHFDGRAVFGGEEKDRDAA